MSAVGRNTGVSKARPVMSYASIWRSSCRTDCGATNEKGGGTCGLDSEVTYASIWRSSCRLEFEVTNGGVGEVTVGSTVGSTVGAGCELTGLYSQVNPFALQRLHPPPGVGRHWQGE
jgi:hypothetical protein